jgi:hypothetical protein
MILVNEKGSFGIPLRDRQWAIRTMENFEFFED